MTVTIENAEVIGGPRDDYDPPQRRRPAWQRGLITVGVVVAILAGAALFARYGQPTPATPQPAKVAVRIDVGGDIASAKAYGRLSDGKLVVIYVGSTAPSTSSTVDVPERFVSISVAVVASRSGDASCTIYIDGTPVSTGHAPPNDLALCTWAPGVTAAS